MAGPILYDDRNVTTERRQADGRPEPTDLREPSPAANLARVRHSL
jgi:hypothetical protein